MADDTGELLRTAVQRAGRVRSALTELRERTFAGAAGNGADDGRAAAQPLQCGPALVQAPAAEPSRQPIVLPVLVLPQGLSPGFDPRLGQLPAELRLSMGLGGGDAVAALVGAATSADMPPFSTGELRASPKTSRREHPRRSRGAAEAAAMPAGRDSGAAAGSSTAPGNGGGSSGGFVGAGGFEDVLAALQAEGVVQLTSSTVLPHGFRRGTQWDGERQTEGGQAAAGQYSSQGGRGGLGPSRSGRQDRQQTQAAGRQHGEEQQRALPAFDLAEVERQLREKLELVNAASRHNHARLHSRAGSTDSSQQRRPAAAPVPRLPLASLSRPGSAGGSRCNSAREHSQENEQQQQQWRPWQLQGSPERAAPAGGRTAAAAPSADGDPAAVRNFLPLARDVPSGAAGSAAPQPAKPTAGSAAARVAAPVPSAQPSRRQSRISLSELLSASSGSIRALPTGSGSAGGTAGAHSGSVSQRRSVLSADSASNCGAASAAVAAQAAGAEAAGGPAVLRGEEGAPPLQPAPGLGERQQSAAGHPGSKLAHRFDRLQSPPATPLDAPLAGMEGGAAGRAETAASSSSSSQASTASSSPEARQEATPLRSFPPLADQQAPQQQQQAEDADGGQAAADQQQQQQPPAAASPAVGQQQRRPASVSGSGAQRPPSTAEHTVPSSIGRKRGNSEVGCEEGPTSVKKHSPEVSTRRLLAHLGDPAAASPAGRAAAAGQQGQQQHQAGLFGTTPEPFADSSRQERQQAAHASSSSPPSHAGAAGGPVMPVVLQSSPRQQRRRQPEQQQPRIVPAQPPLHSQADGKAAAVPAAGRSLPPLAARGGLEARPVQQQQQQPSRPAAAKAPAAAPARPLPAKQDSQEAELPAQSCWLPPAGSRSRQQQYERQQQQGPLLQSTSVLITGTGRTAAPPQQQTTPPAVSQQPQQTQQQQPSPFEQPSPAAATPQPPRPPQPDMPSLQAATEAAAAATAVAAGVVSSARRAFTPRLRGASLEAPEAELCLKDHPQGRQLLSAAPAELEGMPAAALLDAARQGCVVRKAWVRPNFKQGGSTRRIHLAPGSGGRPELLYASGLLRKPLRFAVRRVVVRSPAWRPGDYLVLDTARGMLRIEPGTAAEHARWVLALNAAFLASGAGCGGGGGGAAGSSAGGVAGRADAWQRQAVGEMRWSPAILLS